ncbi:MAG TPA: Eco57I restriction-modification methylase domain-containing protein [Candidatus Enterosoma merdigallinarum]|nr:Eco57I restriction-modification methylase domain-containing protein [Candidatus Enterosoma merdigallinarum]
MGDFGQLKYYPDVLSCLANLSNDEVFTPPSIANKMLDLLPQELFSDPNTKFLDPCCKSGIFLREITKRLIKGLKDTYPDLQQRIDHILHEQVYGIAITELTSLMSRRSLYCSKYPSYKFSVSKFENPEGNIVFHGVHHTWGKNGNCIYCGANKEQWDRGEDKEKYAYEFIHTDRPEDIFKMKFDVIIGNPPYQMGDGGGKGSSSIPLYDKFVENAFKLNPRYVIMIIKAVWYSGGKGLTSFRNKMLSENKIKTLVDYFDASKVFPGADISGGVCYFLWDRTYNGKCEVINSDFHENHQMLRPLLQPGQKYFVRFNSAISILQKIAKKGFGSFSEKVSERQPFGIGTIHQSDVSSNYKEGHFKIYGYKIEGYIPQKKVTQNLEAIKKWKVFIAKAYGERGSFPYWVLGKPFIGEPGSVCSETYLLLGSFDNRQDAEALCNFVKTKFFRFLVLLLKNTQNCSKETYSLVPDIPLQLSSKIDDEFLNSFFELDTENIAFINQLVKTMKEDEDHEQQ